MTNNLPERLKAATCGSKGHTKAGTLMLAWLAREGFQGVCTYDGVMAEIGHQLWPEIEHPVNRAKRVGQHLRRDVRFENLRINAHDIKGRPCILSYYRADKAALLTALEAEGGGS